MFGLHVNIYVYFSFTHSFMHLLTVISFVYLVTEADDSEDEDEELGGLFRVSRPQKSKKFQADAPDCSRFNSDFSHNWDLEEVK